jgi:hypothetical protein
MKERKKNTTLSIRRPFDFAGIEQLKRPASLNNNLILDLCIICTRTVHRWRSIWQPLIRVEKQCLAWVRTTYTTIGQLLFSKRRKSMMMRVVGV